MNRSSRMATFFLVGGVWRLHKLPLIPRIDCETAVALPRRTFMRTRSSFSMLLLGVFSMVAAAAIPGTGRAQATPQSPILDAVTNKVILRYQQSSCEQLWQKK